MQGHPVRRHGTPAERMRFRWSRRCEGSLAFSRLRTQHLHWCTSQSQRGDILGMLMLPGTHVSVVCASRFGTFATSALTAARHREIDATNVARAGNAAMQAIIDGLYVRTGPWLAHGIVNLVKPDHWLGEHTRIIDALQNRDGQKARELMEKDAKWGSDLYQRLSSS